MTQPTDLPVPGSGDRRPPCQLDISFRWRQYGEHCSFRHLRQRQTGLARSVRVFVASWLQLNATRWNEHEERNRILAGRRGPPTWQPWASPGAQQISEGSAGVLVFSLICGAALRTVAADFKPGDDNVEAAISLNLAL